MRSSARRGISRRWGAVTVGLTVLGMLVPTTTAVATEPPRQTPSSDAAIADGPSAADDELTRFVAAAGGSVPVTLVTGDTLRVGVDDHGKPVVRATDSAPRADGLPVVFHTLTRQGNVYVVPDDALVLVSQGLLDWSLFDLRELVRLAAAGRSGSVPVLVTYTGSTEAAKKRKVDGASGGRALPSINGRSLKIAEGGRWWQGVRGKKAATPATARSAGSLAGVKKVWLNGLSHVDLERSVPQIGAPVAWERGYDGTGVTVAVLDTGIDATHPDVSAAVVGKADFTGTSAEARDGHGHGTHVASTVLGSGAASKGLRKGVAPGAKLLVGKVCTDNGECPDDAIIAGMDWAAHSGAKVVNLSLGGEPTDGTDPTSQALNELSRTTGTLFVVAAGNHSFGTQKVTSPGSADEALTVAAVDSNDEMALFSNTGPRFGDGAAKPDISGPGVDIVAARAAGTTMGTPVDQYYTTSSGTSMATPHVVGAAAIVAQQHPDMNAQQIKALLMDTATDLGHDMYSQGTGLVNLETATNPKVLPKGTLNFGRQPYPQSAQTKKIVYTNRTDQAVTLHLSLTATSVDGKPAKTGLFTLGTDQVVIPAGGTADVPVTVDGSVLEADDPHGSYTALMTAHDDSGGIRLNSRIHAFIEAQRFPLTLKIIAPEGAADVRYGTVDFTPVDDQVYLHSGPTYLPGSDTTTAQLYRGTYAADVAVSWRDQAGDLQQAAPIAAQVSLTKATTVTLDLRKAKPLTVRYPEATETYSMTDAVSRVSQTGAWSTGTSIAFDYRATEPNWWVLPTGKVTKGTLTHDLYQSGTTPVITLRATGGGAPSRLSARYVTPDTALSQTQMWLRDTGDGATQQASIKVPRLPVKGELPVVYAGSGSAAELAGVDVRGKLVLLTPTDICQGTCDYTKLQGERVSAAASAGAVGVLVAAPGLTSLGRSSEADLCPDGPKSCPEIQPYAALPVVSLPYAQAQALVERIEAHGSKVRIGLGGTSVPRVYAAAFHEVGQSGATTFRLGTKDLDRVDFAFHSARPGDVHQLSWNQIEAGVPASSQVNLAHPATQRTMTVFVNWARNAIIRFTASWAETGAGHLITHNRTEINDLVLTGRDEIHWNAGPSVPGAIATVRTKSGFSVRQGPCAGCRQGDSFYPTVYLTSAAGGRQALIGILNDETITHEFIELPSCSTTPSPTIPNLDSVCDFRLKDASGKEMERQTVHLPDQNLDLIF
ncbi:S8 family peptidase [Streptomyces justiciae]|uniref:S8 family peptidase n=1 Tax=Streptomyces justiciae TaxID=2780140 RepID=UPI00211787A6|nr:S8 family serine peptidase [Streptomyces justiciae]MCW8383890.1 S8 family serine peptidase [Streptomyces justiciae]